MSTRAILRLTGSGWGLLMVLNFAFCFGGNKQRLTGQRVAENLLVGMVSLEKRECRGWAFARQPSVLKMGQYSNVGKKGGRF